MNLLHIFLLVTFSSTSARAGNEFGNPGDSVAMAFTQAGFRAANFLIRNPSLAAAQNIDAAVFLKKVQSTAVTSKETLTLNGVEVDAINYPMEARIEVSRTRWKLTQQDPDLALKLALHEYLWILGRNDTQYQVSLPLLEIYQKEQAEKLHPTPQSQALSQAFCTSVWSGDFDTATFLVSQGLDFRFVCIGNPHTFDQRATVFGAVMSLYYGFPENRLAAKDLLKALLIHGFSIDTAARSDDYPFGENFIVAALAGYKDESLLETMLNFGANPSLPSNSFGGQSLFWKTIIRAKLGDSSWLTPTAFAHLLEAGANLNETIPLEPSAEALAAHPEWGDCVKDALLKHLFEIPGRPELIEIALAQGKPNLCQKILEFGGTIASIVPAEYQPLLASHTIHCP